MRGRIDLGVRIAAKIDKRPIREMAPRHPVQRHGVRQMRVLVKVGVVPIEPIGVPSARPENRKLTGLIVVGVVLPSRRNESRPVLFPGGVLFAGTIGTCATEIPPLPGDERVKRPDIRSESHATAGSRAVHRVRVVSVHPVGMRGFGEDADPPSPRRPETECLDVVQASEDKSVKTDAQRSPAATFGRRFESDGQRSRRMSSSRAEEVQARQHARFAQPVSGHG